MKSAKFLSQVEHGMVVAHGIPVRIVWSFARSRAECVRVDGLDLTPSMERTFDQLWADTGDKDGGTKPWSN